MNSLLYVALDFPTWEKAKQFIDTNQLHGVPVKVGMELFYREGPKVVERLKENNHSIFLDLKLHDIPTTVMKAMKNIASLEVDIVNVHALGGSEMMKRAKEGLLAGSFRSKLPKLIAVTILTSINEKTVSEELLLMNRLQKHVIHYANLARNSNLDGVVCSVHEAKKVKEVCSPSFLTVTPGIRLQDSNQVDQKRVATPAYARENGADILVIGRSITEAVNPREAYQHALLEWGNSNGS